MRWRTALLASVGVLSLGAASAAAAIPRAELQDAQAVAADRFGEPCSDPISVRFHVLRHDTLGMARWRGMWDIPPAEREDCTVLLNSRKSWNWRTLCTTVVHEYGHLAGRHHDGTDSSVMHATYTRAYKGCVRGEAARRWDD